MKFNISSKKLTYGCIIKNNNDIYPLQIQLFLNKYRNQCLDFNLFKQACIENNIIVIRWFIKNFPKVKKDFYHSLKNMCNFIICVKNPCQDPFHVLYQNNHLDILLNIIQTYKTSSDMIYYLFIASCIKNNIYILYWIKMNNLMINKDGLVWAFRMACTNGHLSVIRWLINNILIIDQHIIINTFIDACQEGHVNIAQYIKNYYPNMISITDAFFAFQYACRNGYLHCVRWVISEWPVIAQVYSPYILTWTSPSNSIAMMNWAKSEYPEIDLQTVESIFKEVCQYGQLHIAQWLKENWPELDHNINLEHIHEKSHSHILQWLKTLK